MARIPPTQKKQPEDDPDVPVGDAESDNVDDIVNNLPDDMLDDAWDAEVDSWADLNIHPQRSIAIDQFLFKSRLDVLIQTLVENTMIDEEVFNNRVKRYMLKTMMMLRREHKQNLLHAKLTEGIQTPQINPKPGMFLPPGMGRDG